MKVSTALRVAREQAGLTQREIGRHIGYSAKMISAIERGERRIASDVAIVTARLLDNPEFYMALGEDAAAGVMVPILLDGPKVDLHRMSTGQKAIEEQSEAARAIAQAKVLINSRGPEDLTEETRRQLWLICRECLQAGTAAFNTVRVICGTYGFSPERVAAEVTADLERKGYIQPRRRGVKQDAAA